MKADMHPLRRADAVIIAVLAVICVLSWVILNNLTGTSAEIITDGELLYSIDLSHVEEPYEIALDCGAVILVEKGAVSFANSDCTNKLCVRTGKLTKAGQSAACIPNKTLIRITGNKKTKNDAVAG